MISQTKKGKLMVNTDIYTILSNIWCELKRVERKPRNYIPKWNGIKLLLIRETSYSVKIHCNCYSLFSLKFIVILSKNVFRSNFSSCFLSFLLACIGIPPTNIINNKTKWDSVITRCTSLDTYRQDPMNDTWAHNQMVTSPFFPRKIICDIFSWCANIHQ